MVLYITLCSVSMPSPSPTVSISVPLDILSHPLPSKPSNLSAHPGALYLCVSRSPPHHHPSVAAPHGSGQDHSHLLLLLLYCNTSVLFIDWSEFCPTFGTYFHKLSLCLCFVMQIYNSLVIQRNIITKKVIKKVVFIFRSNPNNIKCLI